MLLFLCGDVMTGRGIDQVLGHPSQPELHESWVDDARDYVMLAERLHGPLPRRADPAYVWGDALEVLERLKPDARIINLETAVTRSDDWSEEKGIHYRMHPENAGCLSVAGVDVAVLANNHVLDWGVQGLHETLEVLEAAGIRTAGAGRDLTSARAPARVGNVLVFAAACPSSGVPQSWAATLSQPGVDVIDEQSQGAADELGERIHAAKRPGDVVVASLHWGSNWGHPVPEAQRSFAHRLIDRGADVVHGHSSHHPRPMELYRDRLVLYGSGDFINDYEGISGFEQFRPDLALMLLAALDSSGALEQLRVVVLQRARFRLGRAIPADARWMAETLTRISEPFGGGLERRWVIELPS